MTHVFIFNNASRGAGYGVGTYVTQLAKGLGHSPEFAVSIVDVFSDVEDFSMARDSSGLLHYRIPAPAVDSEGDTYNRCVYYYLARNVLVGENVRVVFQFNYYQHLLLARLLKAHFQSCRIVLTVHYFAWAFGLGGDLWRFREIVSSEDGMLEEEERKIVGSFKAERAFLRLSDEVIVLSRFARNVLVDDYGISARKLHLVYNGLGNECLGRTAVSPRNIVFVGRLDEIKGVGYLLLAFRQLVKKYKDLRLLVVGDGDFPRYLRMCMDMDMSARVSFLGKLGADELEKVYETAYAGVLPSFHEQCSYSVIEMMRHGIPVVGTDSTGLSEMLDATPSLRVCIGGEDFDPTGFSLRIASRLELLLNDGNIYDGASYAVRELYLERYTADRMLDGMEEVLKASIAQCDGVVSPDYLLQMDSQMVELVNSQPDMGVDILGISGIGAYLWSRVLGVLGRIDESQSALLQEHLVYYLDWLCEEARQSDGLPDEMLAVLRDMRVNGFLPRLVEKALESQNCANDGLLPEKGEVLHNALRICNYKI